MPALLSGSTITGETAFERGSAETEFHGLVAVTGATRSDISMMCQIT
jgi:hypothetical protein